MSQPGTIGWFAQHEARLAWRDWLALMTAGSRRRARTVAIGFLAYACFIHGLAYLMVTSSGNFALGASTRVLVVLTGTLVMAWSLMLSQALESVTRAFYARGDLELILSSPVAASRLFAVRIAAMTVTIVGLALVLAGPFINVLVWLGGAHWLGGYVAIVALAMDAVAISVVATVALFRAIGPARTRVVAQIVAAVVGAAFAIGMQLAAIVSYGTMSRMAILSSTGWSGPRQTATVCSGGRPVPSSVSRLRWPPCSASASQFSPRRFICLHRGSVSLLWRPAASRRARRGGTGGPCASVPCPRLRRCATRNGRCCCAIPG